MTEKSFREVRETFMDKVFESVSHMPREQAQQRISYIITGVYNELARQANRLPAKPKAEEA